MSSATAPRLFTGESVETPKHDDMLLLMKEDSDFFKKVVNRILRLEMDKFKSNKNIAIFNHKGDEWMVLKNSIFTFGDEYYAVIRKRIKEIMILDGELLIYDMGPYHKANKDDINRLIEEGIVEKIEGEITYGEGILFHMFEGFKVIDWIPEDAIINHGYYIGSVDLNVGVEASYSLNISYKDKIWYFGTNNSPYRLIFEFKPKIKSYSETLRQVNVYRKYKELLKPDKNKIENFCFAVLTYSNIDKFKRIFESQGIYIFNIDDFAKNGGE